MKLLYLVVVLALFSSSALAQQPETPRCKGNSAVVGECFVVHGRLSVWNGNPSLRIWPIGTKRMLGVSDSFKLPEEMETRMGHFDDEVYADFEVCPLRKEKPRTMQDVCVESAKNIVKKTRKNE